MGQVPGRDDDANETCGLTASNALSRRLRAREDEVWPDVYEALPASRLREIGTTLGIDDRRLLVTIRHMLAGAFLDQLRSIAGDPERTDIRERRGKLKAIASLAASLQAEYTAALPDIMTDHHEAAWHGPVRWGPSHFRYDYEQLLGKADEIERICEDILNSPAFNPRRDNGVGPTGLPAKLSDRPGSWAKEAFAIRLAEVFAAATGQAPTVSNSQDTAFQKFAALCVETFRAAYRDLGQPFGTFAPPSRRDLRDARARHK